MSVREPVYPLSGKRIFVAGHRGMVGSAIARELRARVCEVVVADRVSLDLTRQEAVEAFMHRERPQAVVVAAAKVGGIAANAAYPADFLYDNLMLQLNLINAAARVGVEKLLMLGSSCIYPARAPQPMREDALMTGPLEATNRWYAVAKIAGLMQCQAYREQHGCDFISAMPTNLYGPGDNFDTEGSHVIPGLMRRFHDAVRQGAEEVAIWGTGEPRREFLHVDDCAAGLVFLLEHYSDVEHVNLGSGHETSIADLARRIAAVVGYKGRIVYDTSRPDGAPRKLLDLSKLRSLGWHARIDLDTGLRDTYAWFRAQLEAGRVRGYPEGDR